MSHSGAGAGAGAGAGEGAEGRPRTAPHASSPPVVRSLHVDEHTLEARTTLQAMLMFLLSKCGGLFRGGKLVGTQAELDMCMKRIHDALHIFRIKELFQLHSVFFIMKLIYKTAASKKPTTIDDAESLLLISIGLHNTWTMPNSPFAIEPFRMVARNTNTSIVVLVSAIANTLITEENMAALAHLFLHRHMDATRRHFIGDNHVFMLASPST